MHCQRVNLILLVGGLVVIAATQTDAIPTPKSCLSFLKDMALEKFKAGLEKTAVVAEFRGSVDRIKERYEQAAEQGLFNPENEDEASKFYYQIALDEVKQMKRTGGLAGKMNQIGQEVDIPEGFACKREQASEDGDADYDMMDMDMDDTGVDKLDLENELDKLNEILESEMGWSMTPEARARMNAQARKLAQEVLQNEVRDLALAAVTGFMSGGVGGAVVPVWSAVAGSLQVKVVRYFMQMLLDILSTYLGHPINLDGQPMNIDGQSAAVAAA